MLGPYRSLVEADSAPIHCPANPHDGASCNGIPPYPSRFPAIVTHAYGALARPAATAYPRVVSLAAALVLLATSASLGAITWAVLATQLQRSMEEGDARVWSQVQMNQALVKELAAKTHPAPLGTTQDHAHAAPAHTAPKPPVSPSASPAHVEAVRAPPHALLARLGPETHAADVLWQRAESLAGSGADVTLVRTTLAHQDAGTLLASGMRIVHEERPLLGVRVVDVGKQFSAPALAGLRVGDQVEAVNGFALGVPNDIQRVFDAMDGRRSLVVEIVRDGRRIALRVDWRG
jgi:hypothetical protein